MIVHIILLEFLFTTAIVNSLPQSDNILGDLYSEDPGAKLALMSDSPTDVDQAFDRSFILSGEAASFVLIRRFRNDRN